MAISRVNARVLVAMSLVNLSILVNAQILSTDFYNESCPEIYTIVKVEVHKAVQAEKRMAASLIRLHFHDCFVNGCDGSLLLDDPIVGGSGEKLSLANINSTRGFEVIDTIKTRLEGACPNTVSCADLLAIAARDSAVQVGLTNTYPVYFGRRDSLTASVEEANLRLPAPFMNYSTLKSNFDFQGLDETDLIALSGAHTIGRVRCSVIIQSNSSVDPNINANYRALLIKACDSANATIDPPLQNLDVKTPDKFDNNYFKNLRRGEGVLTSDQTLQSTPGSNVDIVKDFAKNKENFFSQYELSSIKMGNIRPLTGDQGEIRKNCRVVNSAPPSLIAYE